MTIPNKHKNDRVAVVTGAARGIGLGIASRLAEEGVSVVVWDIDPSPLDAATAGGETWKPRASLRVDVSDPNSVDTAFEKTLEITGHIDIVVNNAGINGPVKPLADYAFGEWNRVLGINLTGTYNVCHAVVPHLVQRGWGRIVNIASIGGKEGVPNISPYSASKAGVIGLTKALSKELITTGVTVNSVAPAMAATELLDQMTSEHVENSKAKIPMGRLLEIDELAALVSWIASEECSFTSGFTFDATGGRATY
ncbi:SDR family NAD(P)-dependent oxidoreductase [Corynebacterium glyciniphilum]|uniref:SDR family NAD(P)-dependent oxidoreductase n=1 Tax=Corynebacterium glyciniphilum TaxID=1404244 RepID=UPI0011AB65C8|nr:SDR family NAD(P)-dependent oxidoreductase [Corynebacterium glyciniphilum]